MPVFATAIFTSAFLLFWVQPLFSRMILPLLGGAPAVWATAMMFFQLVLLAGYGYAHLLTRHVPVLRRQAVVHLLVLAGGFAFLPFALEPGLTPPVAGSPVFWLLGLLAAHVGWPFFALSASAPLFQAWFARARTQSDPYFLYAASNAGSLLALLLFPIALEPALTLQGQASAWRYGYAGLLALVALLAAQVWKSRAVTRTIAPAAIALRDRLLWVALAFVPSSLLLGVTTYITTDIASAPLFWIVPFALYLASFIIAFARRTPPPSWTLKAQAAGMIAVAALAILLLVFSLGGSILLVVGLHLFAFFATAVLCHCELARRRPPASGLTSFYFCLSIGGALGGVFNALVAPQLFANDYEYYLALVAACALRAALPGSAREVSWRDVAFPAVLAAMVGAVAWHAVDATPFAMLWRGLFLLPVSLALYWFSDRPWRFALGMAAVLGAALLAQNTVDTLASERSFFGINRVKRLEDRMALVHGTTIHGEEFVDPARWRVPLAYYARSGPVGQMFAASGAHPRAALVGLGTGAMACYRGPGEDWRFFEIDAAVVRLARDTRWFHYLAQCPGSQVALGDGRLLLKRQAGRYDLIVIDAFSSDAIPMHLLTREAMALYLSKLNPHGLILFNVSNKYLALGPVLGNVVAAAGAHARREVFYPSEAQLAQGATAAEWMVIAADDRDLAFLKDPRWKATAPRPGARPWSDDFSDIVSVMHW